MELLLVNSRLRKTLSLFYCYWPFVAYKIKKNVQKDKLNASQKYVIHKKLGHLGYEVCVKKAGSDRWEDFFIPESDVYNPVRYLLIEFALTCSTSLSHRNILSQQAFPHILLTQSQSLIRPAHTFLCQSHPATQQYTFPPKSPQALQIRAVIADNVVFVQSFNIYQVECTRPMHISSSTLSISYRQIGSDQSLNSRNIYFHKNVKMGKGPSPPLKEIFKKFKTKL